MARCTSLPGKARNVISILCLTGACIKTLTIKLAWLDLIWASDLGAVLWWRSWILFCYLQDTVCIVSSPIDSRVTPTKQGCDLTLSHLIQYKGVVDAVYQVFISMSIHDVDIITRPSTNSGSQWALCSYGWGRGHSYPSRVNYHDTPPTLAVYVVHTE